MIQFVLLLHLGTALLSLIFATKVVAKTSKQKMKQAASSNKHMWQSTVVTVISGVGLAIITRGVVSRTCISLLSFLLVIMAAHYYQRHIVKTMVHSYTDEIED